MRPLDHERLVAYRLARQYNRGLNRLLARLETRGWGAHIDQLRRSGGSIGLNLAEGSGEYSPLEKARFYRIARRSATESAAGLDYLVDVELACEEEIEDLLNLLRRLVGMVVLLIRANEVRD